MPKPPSTSDGEAFDHDVAEFGGYRYTTSAPLSSTMANARLTAATMGMSDWRGKRVIDIGCGDGTYTVELCDQMSPAHVLALDPAQNAIEAARAKVGRRPIVFQVGSAYQIAEPDGAFDIAYLRGVLHHMDRPEQAIGEALRVARELVIIEPNGYNPVLKLLERFSRYHREHAEKSYPAVRLRGWVRRQGGRVERQAWAGLVPFFCPAWMAKSLKLLEPWVERCPLVNATSCAVVVILARRV